MNDDTLGNHDVGVPFEFLHSVQTEPVFLSLTENALAQQISHLENKLSDMMSLISDQNEKIKELDRHVLDMSEKFMNHFQKTEDLVNFVQTQLSLDERHLNLSIRKGYCVPFQKSHVQRLI